MITDSLFEDLTTAKQVSLRLQGYEKETKTLTPRWNPFKSRWIWKHDVATFCKLVKALGIADPKDPLILGQHLRDFKSPIFQHPSLEIEVDTWNKPDEGWFFELDTNNPIHVFIILSTDHISEASVSALLSKVP